MLLKAYIEEKVTPKRVLQVTVQPDRQSVNLPLYVIEGSYSPIFGRSWLKQLRINWNKIKSIRKAPRGLKKNPGDSKISRWTLGR